jgi:hypothetical protein
MAERIISHAEINLASTVFQGRLPYHLIRIKDDLGLEGRPWTEPGVFGNYILHMGPTAYNNCASTGSWIPGTNLKRINVVFIHELTHVWQGFHGLNYVLSSLVNQCCGAFTGVNPYTYTVGKNWSQYNAEQQGKIVEDWFNPAVGNMTTSSSRFRYIRDNIRKGLIAP